MFKTLVIISLAVLVHALPAATPAYQPKAPVYRASGAQTQYAVSPVRQNAAMPGSVRDQYKLSPNDLLRVEVTREPDLKKEVRVEADGTITLPFLGKVTVGGSTVIYAEQWIQTLYNTDYLVDPQVSILVLEFSERKVNVIGQVNRPGQYAFPIGETMTLTEAIAAAGGFNLRASKKDVQITHKNDSSEPKTYNVKKILEDPKVKDPELRENDTIYVKEGII